MKRTIGTLAAVTALVAIPTSAAAQDQTWLRDRKYTEGMGFRAGDFEIHPGFAAEFGYDSNYRHNDTDPVGSLRLRLTPSLSLSTLGAQRREQGGGGPPPSVEFRASLSGTYNEFFPVSGPAAAQGLMHQQRNASVNADLGLTILPTRPWSGQIYAGYARAITPPEIGGTAKNFNRDMPKAGAELIWTPGSGLLDWRLGYEFSGTFFEAGEHSGLTNIQNQIQTRGRWRFFPRTALIYDARFGFITYTNPGTNGKSNSHPLRAQIGVNGLITNSFSVLAMVGWGASFYTPKPQEDFNSVIGQLELKWYITPNPSSDPAAAGLSLSSVAVGFVRDFYDNYFGTFYERDRGYGNFSYFIGGRFLVVLEGGAAAIRHPKTVTPFTADAFTDIRVDASLFGEYRFKNPFGINATIRYNQNVSNQMITVPGGTDSLAFKEFEAYLGARWLM